MSLVCNLNSIIWLTIKIPNLIVSIKNGTIKFEHFSLDRLHTLFERAWTFIWKKKTLEILSPIDASFKIAKY